MIRQFLHIFKTAIVGLRVNKVRSMLTVLGIVIGITSIILIVSIGKGAEALILNQLQGMGADMIVVRPGEEPTGLTDISGTLFADSLKVSDVVALKRKANVPELISIAPAIVITGNASYQSETYTPLTFGWSAEFFGEIMNVYPERGQFFTESDIKAVARVAVIGSKVEDELFGGTDAVGKNIKLKGQVFRVVAVLPPKGQAIFGDIDTMIIIPYTTARIYISGIDYYHEVMLRVSSPDVVERSVRDIEITLRERHKITDPDKDDFFVVTQQAAVDQIAIILNVLTLFLSSVVAISLLVGGIGVMNIMLVSVTERTKEIGLRKALGATEQNILTQFLIESIVLTGIGGVIGIFIGAVLSFLVSIGISQSFSFSLPFHFPTNAAILGIGVSALVGLVFGLYPARQASKKSPMEALRYE